MVIKFLQFLGKKLHKNTTSGSREPLKVKKLKIRAAREPDLIGPK
jgi:hypothetical protein